MHMIIALLCGCLFGAGLVVAQMTNPQKILNFLDVAAIATGRWDPSLLMVFVGALPVMFAAYQWQRRLAAPWLGTNWTLTGTNAIDTRLVVGSTMFGVGWGLVGLCPGPAVAALALVSRETLGPVFVFFGAMMTGVWVANVMRLSGSAGEPAAAV